MNKGTELLRPLLVSEGMKPIGKACIGTVEGDLHDIGKNLVSMMMESKGLKVIDLGVDVPTENFINAAKENNADVIAMSALLTTTMSEMKAVVEMARKECPDVKIMVGGAPVSQGFADTIGADAYNSDATSAAETALALCAG